jgi:hypothetical protein
LRGSTDVASSHVPASINARISVSSSFSAISGGTNAIASAINAWPDQFGCGLQSTLYAFSMCAGASPVISPCSTHAL